MCNVYNHTTFQGYPVMESMPKSSEIISSFRAVSGLLGPFFSLLCRKNSQNLLFLRFLFIL